LGVIQDLSQLRTELSKTLGIVVSLSKPDFKG